jgi:hypothetical protein
MTKLIGLVVSLLIVLAGAASAQQPSAGPRRDVLILRASGSQAGQLQGCTGATCSFSGRPHSRPEILMLGLAVTASDAPPAIADPFLDAVYLRNAGVVKSKLVSIDARQVVTEQGSYPRADVAWVFLALAPSSPRPRGDWVGTFESTSVCEGPPGFGIKVRSIGDLALDHDGNGNLTGTLAGTTPENLSFAPSCSETMLAPGTFSARLVGSYTPGRDTFSVRAVDVRTRGGRKRTVCPAGSHVSDPPSFYHVLEAPMFGYAFRDLRREPDGSLKSKGEQAVGYGNGSCATNYSLTLRQARN